MSSYSDSEGVCPTTNRTVLPTNCNRDNNEFVQFCILPKHKVKRK